jgi:hypothetical protein
MSELSESRQQSITGAGSETAFFIDTDKKHFTISKAVLMSQFSSKGGLSLTIVIIPMKKNTAGKISVGASIFMVLAVCLFRKEKVFCQR